MTPDAPTHLRWMSRTLGDGDLRPYLPGAVVNILKSICLFENRPLLLDPPMIERIAEMYFTQAAEHSLVQEMAASGEIAASFEGEELPQAPPAIFSRKVTSIFAAPTTEERPPEQRPREHRRRLGRRSRQGTRRRDRSGSRDPRRRWGGQ